MKHIKNKNLQQQFIASPAIQELFPIKFQEQLQLVTYQAGETICQQGEQLAYLSVFLQGKIKVLRRLFNGREHIFGIYDQPNIIGDIELMTGESAISSVVAIEESWVLQLPLHDTAELLSDTSFLYNIGKSLAHILYAQGIQSATNVGYSVKERLATHILSIENEGYFRLELGTLADSFGTSYRHLLRVIRELLTLGILSKEKKLYHIEQKTQLKQWAIEA